MYKYLEKLHVIIFCSSIANLKCTLSDWKMYPCGYMYPRLGTPALIDVYLLFKKKVYIKELCDI